MFALEITFAGEAAATETIFVRRPLALIGAQEDAHVVIDDMKTLNYHLRVCRDLERKFRLTPVGAPGAAQVPQFLEGVYDGEATIDLGPVKLRLTALDIDLLIKETEAPDRAGVRILRQACGGTAPRYPALIVSGDPSVTVSFTTDQPVYIGRSRQCSLRLDSPTISSKHARVGYESGEFWVEDLGSTNGTFVNGQQIAGRVNVQAGVPISFGREVTVVGVVSQEQLARGVPAESTRPAGPVLEEQRYPILVSLSEAARPARIVLSPGSSLVLGRDPASDVWLGAPHVSRRHCAVEMTKSGVVRIIDQSTNGTAHGQGVLRRGETLETTSSPMVLDFGNGITVAVCFSEREEKHFIASAGSVQSFANPEQRAGEVGREAAAGGKRQRRTTTFLRAPGEHIERAPEKASRFGAIAQMYKRLSRRGQVVMALIVAGVFGLLTVIASLLLPVLK
jgi:pSer/pThr/pTyr-binding forkhead associated (FHA) protein